MARGLRFTKAERDFLKFALGEAVDWGAYGSKAFKAAETVRAKVVESESAAATLDVAPIEAALIATARGKVIALEGGFARARVQATACKATVDDAQMVGAWMSRQGWLTGPMTLIDVLNKWHQWTPKARATQPPPALSPGLGTDAPDARSPAAAGKAAAGGRSTQGFR